MKKQSPWTWIPSLYFVEGIPYVIVMVLSVAMYKRLGISNADIALYTSWLYLPWVIKPLWSPVVDILRTKRFWIISMQLIFGATFAGVALTIPVSNFFQWTLMLFFLLAFSSATHDIAADGFYMIGLSERNQAFFIGIRSMFYRFAMLTGQGLLVILAGFFETSTGLPESQAVVNIKPDITSVINFNPTSINISADDNNEPTIVFQPIAKTFSAKTIIKDDAELFISEIKAWNIANGFYFEETPKTKIKKHKSTWYAENISHPLSNWLKKHFGEQTIVEKQTTNKFGNLALLYCHLTSKPQNEVVVNISHKKGNGSLQVYKEDGKTMFDRFVFDESNWNKPAFTIIQIDSRLKQPTQTTFSATSGNIPLAWSLTFAILTILIVVFVVYHSFILPHPKTDTPATMEAEKGIFSEFFTTFRLFFKKDNIGVIILFLLTYRLGESQLVKLAVPFLLDSREVGGLGLTTGDVGIVYGTVGIIALTLGGILGGIMASRFGLKYWLWWMFLCINIPNATYIYLSYSLPENLIYVCLAVAAEQFGYGFGFTAFMLYMIYISRGRHKTAHFAIATGFMALGMMIPGMWSGWLQEAIGYQHFFIWIIICIIPSAVVLSFVKVDAEFGVK